MEEQKFRPGRNGGKLKSGGSLGRPKKLPELEKLVAEVLGGDTLDNARVKKIMEAVAAKAERGDVRAAELLLDRAYGKAPASLDITSGGEPISLPMISFVKTKQDESQSE